MQLIRSNLSGKKEMVNGIRQNTEVEIEMENWNGNAMHDKF